MNKPESAFIMSENAIFQIIGQIPTYVTVIFIICCAHLLIRIAKLVRKSDSILTKFYTFKAKKKERESLLYTTADDLKKLKEVHLKDIESIQGKIDILVDKIDLLSQSIEDQLAISNNSKQRELRNQIIKDYEYYTGTGRDKWTDRAAMEFWELVDDYEAHGGNGYVHATIVPAMKNLKIN